ncbi:MAG: His/Gly/Thr/Pro-type tRNA ligase C-terminal domain-containing protein, partial [Ferrovibrionaceae bacterium]
AFGDADLRVALDQRPERLGRKVVRAREEGIPVLAAIGRREAEEGTVSLRWPDGGQERLALSAAIARIAGAARPGLAI